VRAWLFRRLFGAECAEVGLLRNQVAALQHEIELNREHYGTELEALRAAARGHRPTAKIALADQMTPDQIEARLAGTAGREEIKAVFAYLSAELVRRSDLATNPPSPALVQRDGALIPAFDNEARLHTAGGADALADVLRVLQYFARERDDAPETGGVT